MPHKALIEKLQVIGLDVYLQQWITNYLTNHMQYVVVNFFKASPCHFLCATGVCPGAPSFPHLATSMELLSYHSHLRAN